jgi:hypothetical protein
MVVTPEVIGASWAVPWYYFGTYWWWYNWLNFSVTGYDIVMSEKNVTIESNGLIDKFTEMGNSQTFVKGIPGTSGITERNFQVYAIPTGTPYTISDPASNQSTILITRVNNESGQLAGSAYLLNASTTQGSLNFTATPSHNGLSISAGDNALNASVTCCNATLQGYSVSEALSTQIDAGQNVTLAAHCLASCTVSKNIVGKGYSIPVNVTITNVGNHPENVSITLYANSTALDSETVFNLVNGTSANLTCIWNTTSYAYGNYALNIYCEPSGINEAANNFTYADIVEITIPGDITGPNDVPDGRVDMKDVSYVARRFPCLPGDPLWDSNADINGDGKVDMKDIAVPARHFGEHI